MSNAITTDAFGHSPIQPSDTSDFAALIDEQAAPDPVIATQTSKKKVMPLWQIFAIFIVGILIVGLIAAYVVSRLNKKPEAAKAAINPPAAQAQASPAASAASVGDLAKIPSATLAESPRAEPPSDAIIKRLDDRIMSLESRISLLQAQLASKPLTTPLSIAATPLARLKVKQPSKTVEAKGFAQENVVVRDATIVSIGSGLARIRRSDGMELQLQRGDRLGDTSVKSILADTREIVLSDGRLIR